MFTDCLASLNTHLTYDKVFAECQTNLITTSPATKITRIIDFVMQLQTEIKFDTIDQNLQ